MRNVHKQGDFLRMIDSFRYQPRTGNEVRLATGGAPVYLYSELAEQMKAYGAVNVFNKMMNVSNDAIILLQDPQKMRSGHWIALKFVPEQREIYFFSSYGGKPDFEKNEWISPNDLVRSNQYMNVLNDGLKQFALSGWTIHYNQYRYQHVGDNTATCGIWTAAFLNSGMNPDDFFEFNLVNDLDEGDYYRLLF